MMLVKLGVLGGPGDSLEGWNPKENDSTAQRLLMRLAQGMSRALLPVAEVSPTDTVASNLNTVTAATTTNGISIQWPSNGIVVGIRATTRDGAAASMAGMLLRVQIDGNTELFPSAAGNGPGYLPFAMISGSAAFLGRYAMRREFKQTTYWQFYLQNTTAGTLVADVAFDIVRTSNLSTS
jgi:hypothetical protein